MIIVCPLISLLKQYIAVAFYPPSFCEGCDTELILEGSVVVGALF